MLRCFSVHKALGVIAVTAVALAVVAGSGAAVERKPLLPAQPQAMRGIPPANVALQRALAIFRPRLAEPAFRGLSEDPRGATMALRDLAATKQFLQGRDRRLANAILSRPTDGRQGDYTAPKGDFRRTCPPNVCIHWVTSSRDAPSLTDRNPRNHIPDWIDRTKGVMKTVWSKEISTFGYRKPKPDKPYGGHRGGNPNSKLDIFIQDIGRFGLYGYCTTDDPRRGKRRDVSAYCVFDDDYKRKQFPGIHGVSALKVTAAHEFHHASQFAYDWKEDRALMEGTATNMEADVYGSIHDNYQYFVSSPLRPKNNANNGPWWPVDLFDAQPTDAPYFFHYGSWIFYRFLEEYFGDSNHPSNHRDIAINRQIWTQAKAVTGTNKGGKYSTQAIAAAIAARTDPNTTLPATFRDVFATFGYANARPDLWYRDGALYPRAGSVNRGSFGPGDTNSGTWGMYHFSNDYLLFKTAADALTGTTIDFTLNFPDTSRGSNATIVVLNANGTITVQSAELDSAGDAIVTGVPFDDANVNGVLLVITNDSLRMKQCGSYPLGSPVQFACRGVGRDDLNGYNFSVAVNGP
jgi:hypothetical protein